MPGEDREHARPAIAWYRASSPPAAYEREESQEPLPLLSLDPVRLAKRQLEIDRERTGRFPHLTAHKVERMTASPLALLRGSAPLFYELLEKHPALYEGPPGDGWLVGDCHLENFGAYRAGSLSAAPSARSRVASRAVPDDVVFDLNDFDDAFVGPWRIDVLRLMTSLILGGREMGTDGPATLDLCDALLDAYVGAAFHRKKALAPCHAVTALVDKVRARSRKELLDARTEIVRGVRRFVRGPRYEDVTEKLRKKSERAFSKYAKRLPKGEQPGDEALTVIDAAFRVAGTGSLGCLRIALLVRGKGGIDGGWVFDMKAEDTPSAACLVRPPKLAPAERVETALRTTLARPPRMIGTTALRGESMFVRRLSPQEDKINLANLSKADLAPLARHLGALLGAAHRRGAKRIPKKAWKAEDRAHLLARAVGLAGLHEALYLSYCDAVRR
jgi:uncharacterized protein (DUF2252 family)